MAKLSRFKANTNKINDGDWVTLGEEFGNIEIKTKGFTDKYNDARQARIRRAALRFAGDSNKIPAADLRKIIVDLLIENCLLDVRNLQDENGIEVTFDVFKELLYDPNFLDLYMAVISAAAAVTNEREADLEDTKKNLPTS